MPVKLASDLVDKKVAYIFLNASDQDNSVQRKVAAQIKGLVAEGVEIKGFFFTFRERAETYDLPHIHSLKVAKAGGKYLLSVRKRNRMTRELLRWASQNAHLYDVLYLRNYRPSIRWWWFMLKYGKKCITEHQTKELPEIMALTSENPFGWRPGRFLGWLEFAAMPVLAERIWGSLALGATSKVVAVTGEIAEYERNRAFPKKPSAHVVSNGIDVMSFPLRTAPVFDGNRLILFMLVGGSTAVDWHGIDLVMEGIKKYKGSVNIEFWLAGNKDIIKKYEAPFVRLLGFCDKVRTDEIADQVHLGLGSFASDRKGLKEACSLKMREYAARGIPAVYGQEDNDYESICNAGLAMKCQSMVAPDIEAVVAFYQELQNRAEFSGQIRKIAIKEMDNKVKMWALKEVLLSRPQW